MFRHALDPDPKLGQQLCNAATGEKQLAVGERRADRQTLLIQALRFLEVAPGRFDARSPRKAMN